MNFGTKAFQQFAPRIIAMTHSPIKLSLLVSLLPCKPKNRCFFLDHISKSCVIVRKNVIANEVIIPVAGIHDDIIAASINALFSAINRKA